MFTIVIPKDIFEKVPVEPDTQSETIVEYVRKDNRIVRWTKNTHGNAFEISNNEDIYESLLTESTIQDLLCEPDVKYLIHKKNVGIYGDGTLFSVVIENVQEKKEIQNIQVLEDKNLKNYINNHFSLFFFFDFFFFIKMLILDF